MDDLTFRPYSIAANAITTQQNVLIYQGPCVVDSFFMTSMATGHSWAFFDGLNATGRPIASKAAGITDVLATFFGLRIRLSYGLFLQHQGTNGGSGWCVTLAALP